MSVGSAQAQSGELGESLDRLTNLQLSANVWAPSRSGGLDAKAREKLYAVTTLGTAAFLTAGVAACMAQASPRLRALRRYWRRGIQFRNSGRAHTDVCAYLGSQQANTNYIDSLADDYCLQGSCCTPIVHSHYASQVAGLKNYSGITIMPRDPYNVSASQAKEMISFDAISLTSAQQAVYNASIKREIN